MFTAAQQKAEATFCELWRTNFQHCAAIWNIYVSHGNTPTYIRWGGE